MIDERERRGGQPDAVAAVVAVGAFALFMAIAAIGMLFCHDVFGCPRQGDYLLFGLSFFSLAASMRFAAEAAGDRAGCSS